MIPIDAAGSTTLVSYTGNTYDGSFGGVLVGHLSGDIPNRGELSFATLP